LLDDEGFDVTWVKDGNEALSSTYDSKTYTPGVESPLLK